MLPNVKKDWDRRFKNSRKNVSTQLEIWCNLLVYNAQKACGAMLDQTDERMEVNIPKNLLA